MAASYSFNEDLSVGDRSYLDCEQDRVTDPVTGELLDRVNGSITANGPSGNRNCGNIYFNTVIDRLTGERLIPSPDGIVTPTGTGGTIPGYRPRLNGPLLDGSGRDFYEDVLESPLYLSQDAINERELLSIYGVADFDLGIFGGTNWVTEVMFTNRKTVAEGWRQFFPDIRGTNPFFGGAFAYANDPTYANPLNTVALPVTIWPSNTEIDANYTYLASTFSGGFGNAGPASGWAWALGGNYSVSDADYTRNQIIASATGDWSLSDDAPTFDYFSEEFLSGNYSDALFDTLTSFDTGNTEYKQWLINGSVAGDLFQMPAGTVAAAVGFEYRDWEITDVPGPLTQSGDVWGSSTSGITKGSDTVTEIFGEIEIPLLAGQRFAEEVTFNVSGRAFDYESFGQDSVYKANLGWQVNPAVRLRVTQGTSFRAPALFEQFLEAQTSFIGQFGIDLCDDSDGLRANNTRVDTNCLAEGIPNGFSNIGASALVISGGNGDTLEAETSDSFTAGIVLTPTFADVNIAIDYFEFEIDNQIAQLGAGSILAACYDSDPAQFATNAFCDLFERAPATDPSAPFAIDNIQDQFLNINSQTQRGVDMEARYEHEFNFGTMLVDLGATWSFESNVSLFAPGTVDGLTNNDFNGTIGEPSIVADSLISLERSDFTYSFFSDFVGHTSNARFADTPDGIEEPYFNTIANVDYDAEATWYHGASVRWTGDTWTFTGGIRNLFDEHPAAVSAEAATVRGNTPLNATQYDLRGRRGFLTVSKTF